MRLLPSNVGRLLVVLSTLLISVSNFTAVASQVQNGFNELLIANGLLRPISMAFAPDGRLFVCEQDGRLRIIKKGVLLKKPFMTLTNLDSSATDPGNERGLLSVAIDPNFSANKYLYVFYTAKTPNVHNRVSRFTARGDAVVRDSEMIILELEDQHPSDRPGPGQGGAMRFGADGKLYIAVGVGTYDNYPGTSDAQNLSNYWGKMLRINADGTVPSDNPFNVQQGARPEIWAIGLRVPFTFAVQAGTGRIFINDVNGHPPADPSLPQWEEINEGIAGANYGWPHVGGDSTDPTFTNPVYKYGHDGPTLSTGCAITGGAFYNPATRRFPAEYLGNYFFADFCNGWINRMNTDGTVTNFASGISSPVGVEVGPEGNLYYLSRGAGAVYKICYGSC